MTRARIIDRDILERLYVTEGRSMVEVGKILGGTSVWADNYRKKYGLPLHGMTRTNRPVEERFAEKYVPEPNSGCWLWTACCGPTGYGRMSDANDRVTGAHRLSWRIHFGEIPDGMCVLHKCDVRCCVNPQHLFLGTQADNVADMRAKSRGSQLRGDQHPRTKLSDAGVVIIRKSKESNVALAARFGISASRICTIRKGKDRILPGTTREELEQETPSPQGAEPSPGAAALPDEAQPSPPGDGSNLLGAG